MTIYGFNDKDIAQSLHQFAKDAKTERTDSPVIPGQQQLMGTPVHIVKTPGGGIAARSGTTISSASCDVYYNDSGTLTKLVDADSNDVTITVYNLETDAIDGDIYVLVARENRSGIYVPAQAGEGGGGATLWRGTANEDMGTSTANEMDCDLLEMDGTDTNSDVTALDPTGIFSGLTDTAAVLLIEQGGSYYVIQGECPAP